MHVLQIRDMKTVIDLQIVLQQTCVTVLVLLLHDIAVRDGMYKFAGKPEHRLMFIAHNSATHE